MPKVYAKRKSARKLERTNEEASITSSSADDNAQDVKMNSSDSSPKNRLINVSSRSSVLQACIITSGLIAALGVIIQQVMLSKANMNFFFFPFFNRIFLHCCFIT